MSQEAVPPPPPAPRRSSGAGWLIGLTLVGVGALGVGAAALYYALQEDVPEVESGDWLRVTLRGQLAEAPQPEGFAFEPDDFPPGVVDIVQAIRHASTDDAVGGVYVELDGVSGGVGSWSALRDALVDVRAAGKPCVVYQSSYFRMTDYWAATACDRVIMAPAGAVMVTGMAMELEYYGGTMELLGITPEFEGVGAYKSAIEAYERTGPSESAIEAYDTLLDSLFNHLVGQIAEGRGRPVEEILGWIDAPVLAPAAALERGMIDATGWPDAVRARVQRYADADFQTQLQAPVSDEDAKGDFVSLTSYLKRVRAEGADGDAVAVIVAEGQIISGDAEPSLFGDDGMLTDGEVSAWLKEAREDDRVKAVVIRVNSPGGDGLASEVMLREVERTKAAGKPVVISMGDLAASGGYMLSTKANHIVAEPTTITGSIGVFGGKLAVGGLFGKAGVTTHAFTRGDQALLFSPVRPFTDAERATFRGWLEAFYKIFVQEVADGRGRTWEQIHEVAQGRVWTGLQAVERGLVDELGSVDVAIAAAARLASIGDPSVIRLPVQKGFFDALMEELERGNEDVSVLSLVPASVRADLAVLDAATRAGHPLALLPGAPSVR